MAIGDISAILPVTVTPGTTASVAVTTPNNEEWTFKLGRGVCLIAPGGTAPTLSVGISAACNELCFNEVINVPTAALPGAKNVIGPDVVTVPPSTPIYVRSSASNAVRFTLTGTRKQIS